MTITVFLGGHIFTGSGTQPGCVAVDQGRIVAVGEEQEVRREVGAADVVVDLAGGLLSPSFGDAHLHPVLGGLELRGCSLHEARSLEDCQRIVAEYAAAFPDEPWIVGGGWSMNLFAGGTPRKEWLDGVVADRPVFLKNADQHGAWVNSKALDVAGIDAHTADPPDGRIERDPSGEPTGTLHEGAYLMVHKLTPEPSPEALDEALQLGQAQASSFGITAWQDALVRRYPSGQDLVDVYLRAVDDGTLRARVTGALWWDRTRDLDQVDELVERRAKASRAPHAWFAADAVKMMIDGVVENSTASLSRPYRDACGCRTDNYGLKLLDPARLVDATVAVDRHGFQVHYHAIGDAAVCDALDAIGAARRGHPLSVARHTVAHLQIVSGEDVRRFAQLNAIANLQPLWACSEPQMTELTLPLLDPELADLQYPFGDLLRAGSRIAAGSDWPVSSMNPLEGIQVAVTRTAIDAADRAEPLNGSQALPLVDVWNAYTRGVAYLNGREDVHGRLEPGLRADLVILDRDPFQGDAGTIIEANVESTWIDGTCVYQRAAVAEPAYRALR